MVLLGSECDAITATALTVLIREVFMQLDSSQRHFAKREHNLFSLFAHAQPCGRSTSPDCEPCS